MSIKVCVKGDCDRFLRKSAERGVILKNITEVNGGAVFLCRKKDLFILKALRRGSGCFLRFESRRGRAFYLKRLILKRPVFPLFLLLCLFFVWCSGAFVWSVRIDGCERTNERELYKFLRETGVRAGVPVKSVRAQRVKNDAVSRFPTIAYLTVNIEGTQAHITVYERRETPPPERQEPCDVISTLTGVITAVRVRRGEGLVRPGQTVQKGDLIATGRLVYKTGETALTAADAEIDVRTWHKLSGVLPERYFSFEKTGRYRKNVSRILFGKRFALFPIESPPYKWYYKKEEVSAFKLGQKTFSPLALSLETFYECEKRERQINANEAERILKEELLKKAETSLKDAEIHSRSFYAFKNNDLFEGVLTVECVETTGIQTEMTEVGADN